jgi:hypothetical protein
MEHRLAEEVDAEHGGVLVRVGKLCVWIYSLAEVSNSSSGQGCSAVTNFLGVQRESRILEKS